MLTALVIVLLRGGGKITSKEIRRRFAYTAVFHDDSYRRRDGAPGPFVCGRRGHYSAWQHLACGLLAQKAGSGSQH
jgi:hypothetical protein